MLTLTALNDCFNNAELNNAKYIGVRIAVGLTKEEVIINPRENFHEKQQYYNHAYDENLRHKYAGDEDIRITGFTFGNSFADIENSIEFYDVTASNFNSLM